MTFKDHQTSTTSIGYCCFLCSSVSWHCWVTAVWVSLLCSGGCSQSSDWRTYSHHTYRCTVVYLMVCDLFCAVVGPGISFMCSNIGRVPWNCTVSSMYQRVQALVLVHVYYTLTTCNILFLHSSTLVFCACMLADCFRQKNMDLTCTYLKTVSYESHHHVSNLRVKWMWRYL